MEAVSWFTAQSARCTVRRVNTVLIFREDSGGHVRDGPASPWSSREFQDLESACDVRRGSAILCQVASADQRRPVRIPTNLPTLQSRLSLHTGPSWNDVATNCSIKAHFQNHVRAFQRMLRSGERTRRSTSSLPPSKSLGTVFWTVCLADLDMDSFFSLWDGVSVPSQYSDHTFSFLFVFSLQGSTLLSLVGRHKLTRHTSCTRVQGHTRGRFRDRATASPSYQW